MPCCVAFGCSVREGDKTVSPPITFHQLPTDKELRKKWMQAIRRENWEPGNRSRLCSKHFREEDFDRSPFYNKLKPGVIPSRFEGFPKHLQKTEIQFLTMDNYLIKAEDIKQEPCRIVIKEEVSFELIEEPSCIDGIKEESEMINDLKEEKTCFEPTDVQRFTSDILKEENILVNLIKKEDKNNINVIEDDDYITEEKEIDYVWPEGELTETDPLALPEIKHEDEFQNAKKEETVIYITSVNLPECSSSKVSDSLWQPKTHTTSYTGVKPFKCNVCEYATSWLHKIKEHKRHHKGLFYCNACEYSTLHSYALKLHMRRHGGEHPFQCNVCEYATSRPDALKVHMRRHTRPFRCNMCEYATSKSNALKIHMLKHTRERPYKCDVCLYATSRSSDLKTHKKGKKCIAKHTSVRSKNIFV